MNRRRNQRMLVAAWITGLALCVVLPTETEAQQASGEAVREGARVYGATCGRCHNPRSPLERRDREWVTIANHMRVRANLTGKQVRSVLAFLQATNSDPRERVPLPAGPTAPRGGAEIQLRTGAASTDPQVIARGKGLTDEKACLGCHVIGSGGGQLGPSLNRAVSRRSVDFVRRKLADPTFDDATSMMPNFGLTSEQIEAIVAFLATLDAK